MAATFENSTHSATLSQSGNFLTTGPTWVDETGGASSIGTWAPARNPGFTFDFGVNNQTTGALDTAAGVSGALALAPQIPYTDVNNDLAGTSEADRYWTLTLRTSTNTPYAFTIYATNEETPDDFDSTTQLADTSGSPLLVASYLSTDDIWTESTGKQGSRVQIATIPIDFAATLTPVSGSATTHAINKLVRHPNWNGKVQLFLIQDESFQINITTATFIGHVVPFHTGQTNIDIKRRARVVHDYILGNPYLSDEAVEDPWREGVMVNSASADPLEQRRHHSYIPPPLEGVVDDDVPNVE